MSSESNAVIEYVTTWFVRLTNGTTHSVWVPVGSSALTAMLQAEHEYGANAQAVRRPGETDWTSIDGGLPPRDGGALP
jgi:hypothetical protein